eukprot:TRINITY_DN9926_c0_g1_i2.p2 TRINITY_DN9926_c0_g1~~TRINITY_DN9926_c0_g1_i2.p2  ORF type:complete len:280 (+),score=63.57 TRINITY_DN9926_c0_g1_i2:1860-2699(+)
MSLAQAVRRHSTMDKIQRLAFFSRLLWPTTNNALTWAGIERGSRVMDLGCGNGHATLGLASKLGRVGRIVGVDANAKALDSAMDYMESHLDDDVMAKIEFIQAQVPDEMAALEKRKFDLIYSRLLFSYVPDPAAALNACKQLLWPGGKVLLEDVDYSSSFCYPASDAFDRYKELHTTVSTQLKGHPNIGPQLFSMFQQAGLVDVRVRCVQPIFTADNEGHAVARITLQDIREQVVHNNLATDAELDELSQELAALEATPGSIVSLPRIFQVTGRAEAAT